MKKVFCDVCNEEIQKEQRHYKILIENKEVCMYRYFDAHQLCLPEQLRGDKK